MLSKRNFTQGHIEDLHKIYPKVSLEVFEMTMFAFGLLQHLASEKLDFIFKGGTSLMLLLPKPKRVSTDIDIMVKPDTDIEPFVQNIEHKFPLLRLSGQSSDNQNGIKVSHFSFACPPIYSEKANVLLDVYFGTCPYLKLVKKPIKNLFLENDGMPSEVTMPSVNSLLGDKMTAFAPNTIGVHPSITSFGKKCDKRLQIIKQLYDINALSEEMTDFQEVIESYKAVAEEERSFRGIDGTTKEFIRDSFLAALSILTLGASDKSGEFQKSYKPGIEKLTDHIFAFDWNMPKAQEFAANAMLLYACLASEVDYKKSNNRASKRFA